MKEKGGRVQKCLKKVIILRISTLPTVYLVFSEHFDMSFKMSLLEGLKFFRPKIYFSLSTQW
ncbi:hypothetical protein RhiirA5_104620 [Rhizophagus irregularis]|uniref:Uncharacterized protein n=2 Tax=Rhizophagus irregularis TaxID=588596 RepID=A0A2N0QDD6_9GLOM|nr:hypothetical protein RhiirA5_104620 [Rhizophagus irregularis]